MKAEIGNEDKELYLSFQPELAFLWVTGRSKSERIRSGSGGV
jgi:hypothetical protein